jgi:hypothetical protein
VVARVSLEYSSWRCPRCGYVADDFVADLLDECPRCRADLTPTLVREDREFSWTGPDPSVEFVRGVLDPQRAHRIDPSLLEKPEALVDNSSVGNRPEPNGRVVEAVPNPRSRVFISYVRDDSTVIDRLTADLRKARLRPWVDRNDLAGGQRWKAAIRKAIQEGSGAVVCFSSHYSARQKTYMNEELTLMIDELRQRPIDKSWFIPVRLDDCTIPDRSIGGGETLHDLQRIDLFPDWDEGVRRIVAALRPPGGIKLFP